MFYLNFKVSIHIYNSILVQIHKVWVITITDSDFYSRSLLIVKVYYYVLYYIIYYIICYVIYYIICHVLYSIICYVLYSVIYYVICYVLGSVG